MLSIGSSVERGVSSFEFLMRFFKADILCRSPRSGHSCGLVSEPELLIFRGADQPSCAFAAEQNRAVHQRYMGVGLWEISRQLLGIDVDVLREQAEIVAVAQHLL